jgi:hypothetical protein
MALNAGQIALLRCEINRTADLARAAGVKTAMPRVDVTRPIVDAQLVDAAATAVGYALTLWEVSTVRALGRYHVFNAAYDSAEKFADAPGKRSLAKHAPNISLLLAAIAQFRGVPDLCRVTVNVPGLAPPAPEIVNATMSRPPAPKAPDPIHRGRKLGYAVVGGLSAATLALVGVAVVNAASDDPEDRSPHGM